MLGYLGISVRPLVLHDTVFDGGIVQLRTLMHSVKTLSSKCPSPKRDTPSSLHNCSNVSPVLRRSTSSLISVPSPGGLMLKNGTLKILFSALSIPSAEWSSSVLERKTASGGF